MSKSGIDVSHYQGKIDWRRVKSKSTIRFCIMKAMYETSRKSDECFADNYQGCLSTGIDKGVYIFLGSKSITDPIGDAKALLSILGDRKLEYGIWLDAESNNLRAIGKDNISKVLITEANIFEKVGYRVGIYCNLDWYKNVLDVDLFRNRYPFWIARYPKQDTGKVVPQLSPQTFAEAWQYSSKGGVFGINGNVDMDIDYSYSEFMANYRMAEQVLLGKYGTANTTPTRKQILTAFGYSYNKVQAIVNAIDRVRKLKW